MGHGLNAVPQTSRLQTQILNINNLSNKFTDYFAYVILM
jgi:hypothetical protein